MPFRRLAAERFSLNFRSGKSPVFRFNSSVLLLSWMIALLSLIALPWPAAGLACVLLSLLAIIVSSPVFRRLVKRSRWLLLAVLLMFGWMTPGMPVPWVPGATMDGLLQAAEQLSRLLISLAMVAILLSRLDTASLLAACYGLLRPLRVLKVDVERLVLRLALTLHQLDKHDAPGSLPTVICLHQQHVRLPDLVLLGMLVLVVGRNWL
jgi:energy-coupling factor transporter transmembrane protein EcfT